MLVLETRSGRDTLFGSVIRIISPKIMNIRSKRWVFSRFTGLSAIFPLMAFLALFQVLGLNAQCQSTDVVTIGVAQAQDVATGLGFNLDPDEDWQWDAARSAGATYGRFQCSWLSVERQTAPPNNKPDNPQYVEDPKCLAGFASAVKYNMRVTVVAAYGAPFHKILTLSLPAGAKAGSTSLAVQLESAVGGDTLHTIAFPYDYLCPARIDESGVVTEQCGPQISKHHSYQGALITGSEISDDQHGTLTLASAVNASLPPSRTILQGCNLRAGTRLMVCASATGDLNSIPDSQLMMRAKSQSVSALAKSAVYSNGQIEVNLARVFPFELSNAGVTATKFYIVNEILYPSAGSDKATDPSVVAYGNYVSFLANDMARHGVKGEIEIWNEPPWANDPWDYRVGLYDPGSYTGPPEYGANFGFAADLMRRHFPDGVTATWNGTSGNGTASLLGPRMEQYTGEKLVQPSTVITHESFHPYNGDHSNPENTMFIRSCLEKAAAAQAGTSAANPFANGANCYLPGLDQTSNSMLAVLLDFQAKKRNPRYGIGHSITETNELPPTSGLKQKQTQAILRQFLGFEADGISPIEFFKLHNRGPVDPSFSFVDEDGKGGPIIPTQAYTALKGVESDISVISKETVSIPDASALPAISKYQGQYPLADVHILGKRDGAKSISDYFVLWQLSSCKSPKDCWFSVPSPSDAPVRVSLPADMRVTSVKDLISRSDIHYSSGQGYVDLVVSDNPVAIMIESR